MYVSCSSDGPGVSAESAGQTSADSSADADGEDSADEDSGDGADSDGADADESTDGESEDEDDGDDGDDDGDDNDSNDDSGSDDESGEDTSSDGASDGDIDPDDLFDDISLTQHALVKTLWTVEWTQSVDSDSSYIEFSFENDEWLRSNSQPGDKGSHSEVVLGVPEGLDFEVRVVAEIAGNELRSDMLSETNAMAPDAMPRPEIESYDEKLATKDRWMLGVTSEKGEGGYGGPHWIYIIDRKGRIVWYHRPQGGDNGELNQTFWPRIARDGTHLTIDRQIRKETGELLFTTLDLESQRVVEFIAGEFGECYDVTDDGHIIYNSRDTNELLEISPSGELRTIWNCVWQGWDCYTNTVNWHAESDTIMLSFPFINTVTRIDRKSGELLNTWGAQGDWKFEPDGHGLEFNHWAHITKTGNFMVSTHLPNTQTHLFVEYEIDEAAETLRKIWSYGEGLSDFPSESGMVERMPNGNMLGNYGPEGVIVEVTQDGELAWRVDFKDRLLGHNLLIDDLYAVNRGI